jgi:hypothetical protein
MYHRRIATAFVFIVLFTAIEVIFASIAWRTFGQNLWEKLMDVFSSEQLVTEEEAVIEEGENQQEEGKGAEEIVSQYNTDDEEDEEAYETEE